MKQSVLKPEVKSLLFKRIDSLTADTKGKWGKLTATQMIRHLTEANRMAFGEVPMPDRSTFLTRTFFRWMILNNIKPPGREKGKIHTFPEIDVVNRNIPVEDIEAEKKKYKASIDRLVNTPNLNNSHTIFGKMTRHDWGYLAYSHADYHLTQFGI